MTVNDLLDDKNTVKNLEFILGMAKDSFKRQSEEIGNPIVYSICKYYQQLNIDKTQEIIDIIKEYQDKDKQQSQTDSIADLHIRKN